MHATLQACWSCRGPVENVALFCHTCGAIQPPAAVDHFARFGLPVRFDIDGDELERRYLGLQQRVHPDRFAAKSARERLIAEQQAVTLNQAYQTLEDPLGRAAYLLTLKGHGATLAGEQTVKDPALLAEMLAAREALAECANEPAVEQLAAREGARAVVLVAQLTDAFAAEDYKRAETLAVQLKYVRKFLEEARVRLAGFHYA
ncbi:MAG TPA: Fe-S protein assembly co-chaperone HscB [Dongiaceae bacterium]|jgi:molecular chaperone HscB|nr:Fe-S protein assembly co-chaperone HscB [Dongiaceae bacterium]